MIFDSNNSGDVTHELHFNDENCRPKGITLQHFILEKTCHLPNKIMYIMYIEYLMYFIFTSKPNNLDSFDFF